MKKNEGNSKDYRGKAVAPNNHTHYKKTQSHKRPSEIIDDSNRSIISLNLTNSK